MRAASPTRGRRPFANPVTIIGGLLGMSSMIEGDVAGSDTAELMQNVVTRGLLPKIRPGQQLLNTANVVATGQEQGIYRVKLGNNKRTVGVVGGNVYYDGGSGTWPTTNMPSGMDSSVTRILCQQVGDFALFQDGVTDPQVTDGSNARILTPVRKPASVSVERTWQFGVEAFSFNLFDNYGAAQDQSRVFNDTAFAVQFTDNGGSVQLSRTDDNTIVVTQTGSPSDPSATFKPGGELQFVSTTPANSFAATIEARVWNSGAKTLTITIAEPRATAGLGIGATGDKLLTQGNVLFEIASGSTGPTGLHVPTNLTIKSAGWSFGGLSVMDESVYAQFLVLAGHSASYPLTHDMRSFAVLVNNAAPFLAGQLELRLRTGDATNASTNVYTSRNFRATKDPQDADWSWVVFDFAPEIAGATGQYISAIEIRGVTGATPPASDTVVGISKFAALGSAPYYNSYRVTLKRHNGLAFEMEGPPYLADLVTSAAGHFPQDESAGSIFKLTIANPNDATIGVADVYRQVGSIYLFASETAFSGSTDLVVYDDARLITSTKQPPSVYAMSCPRAKVMGEYRTRIVLGNVQEFTDIQTEASAVFTGLSTATAVNGSGGAYVNGTYDRGAGTLSNRWLLAAVAFSASLDVDVSLKIESSATGVFGGEETTVSDTTLSAGRASYTQQFYPSGAYSGTVWVQHRYIRLRLRAVGATAPVPTATAFVSTITASASYTNQPLGLYFSVPRAENNQHLAFSTQRVEDAQFEARDLGFACFLPPDAGSELRQIIEVGDLGQTSLIIMTDRKIFRLSGYDARSIQIAKIADHGCQAPESVASINGVVYYLADDSFPRRLSAGGVDVTPVGADIQPTILAATAGDRRKAIGFIKDLSYFLKYDFTNHVGLRYDLVNGKWTTVSPMHGTHACVANLASDDQEVYTISSTRFVRQFWTGTQDQADNASQASIAASIRTHWLTLGSSMEKGIRRFVLRGDQGVTYTVAVACDYRPALPSMTIALSATNQNIGEKLAPVTARGVAFQVTCSWTSTSGKALRELSAVISARGTERKSWA